MEAERAPVPDAYVRTGRFSYEHGIAGGAALLDLPQPPTAVFAGSDGAGGVIEAARTRGLRVPEDLSVVGFDDTPVARLAAPPLTTVRQPLREMGAVAVRTALRLAAGEGLTPTTSSSRPSSSYVSRPHPPTAPPRYLSAVELHISLVGRKDLTGEILAQLREAMDGRLPPGGLPASRELAAQLSVSRTTVDIAYDRLIGEGSSPAGSAPAPSSATASRSPAPDRGGRRDPAPAADLGQPGPAGGRTGRRVRLPPRHPDARQFPPSWRRLLAQGSARRPSAPATTPTPPGMPGCARRSPVASASPVGCRPPPTTSWSPTRPSRRSTSSPRCCWPPATKWPSDPTLPAAVAAVADPRRRGDRRPGRRPGDDRRRHPPGTRLV